MRKNLIKNKVRYLLMNEQIIDGQEMSKAMELICNTMSVSTYKEVMNMLIAAIGTQKQNPTMWAKIQKPINMLRQSDLQINNEKEKYKMTGDSMVDEANTWWSAIQTTICEQDAHIK